MSRKIELKEYEIRVSGISANVFKNGKFECCGVVGIESALEAIFVIENMEKADWLIYEDNKLFLVDR